MSALAYLKVSIPRHLAGCEALTPMTMCKSAAKNHLRWAEMQHREVRYRAHLPQRPTPYSDGTQTNPPASDVDIAGVQADKVGVTLLDHTHAGGRVATVQAIHVRLEVLGPKCLHHPLTLPLLRLRDDAPPDRVRGAVVHAVEGVVEIISWNEPHTADRPSYPY